MPGPVRRKKLTELALLTARAFDAEPPALAGLPWRRRLDVYARFTQEAAEKAIGRGDDVDLLAKRLFDGARAMGASMARMLKVADLASALAAARVLYRALRIDFRADESGDIVVGRCFFARTYTPEVCRLMSAVDGGVLAGLAGGGTLGSNSG